MQRMKKLKSRHYAFSLGLSLVLITTFSSAAGASNLTKDSSVRLNVVSLDCTVDQVYAANSPTYVVNPAGCSAPPVTEVINETAGPLLGMPELISPEATPPTYTPPVVKESEAPSSFEPTITPTPPNYPEDAAPLIPTRPEVEQAPSAIVTGITVGATAIAAVVIIDVIAFHSQLVTMAAGVVRRLVQFIISIIR